MFIEKELQIFETERIRMTHFVDKSDENTYGPYVFEFNTDAQKYVAQYYIIEDDDQLWMRIEEEMAPIIAQKMMYNLLFRIRKILGEKLGGNVFISLDEDLIEKIEMIKDL